MKKFIKFCKKPLCIITACLFVAFTALLVVISCLPHGKEYSYKLQIFGVSVESKIVFDDDQYMSIYTYQNGEIYSQDQFEYKIIDGELYSYPNGTDYEGEYEGKINAYQIVMSTQDSGEDVDVDIDIELKLVCTVNTALKTLSIVMMVVSGLLVATSIIIMATVKDKTTQQTEALDQQNTQTTIQE